MGKANKATEIVKQLQESIRLKEYLQHEAKTLIAIAEQLVAAFRRGNKVLLFGNGGSAADAQHIAAELAGRFHLDRDSLPAIALTTNTSSLTAIANDYGYETVFVHQLRGLVAKGDVAIALSAGGNSPNVVLAIEEAKRRGAVTVGFTGKQGGKLKEISDYVVYIPSDDTPRIQEAHITAGHIICYLVEEALFGSGFA
jgi:D-sedoheptulose 7-phosphate isomerase